jgi:hypothetical protein
MPVAVVTAILELNVDDEAKVRMLKEAVERQKAIGDRRAARYGRPRGGPRTLQVHAT